ncbi:DNA recombination protein RmuC [Crenobacter cavernae]|uniref:DNA recombination protein RmuC n=1 Tax=Crenobacter cavernae TaxID=2290923 RepID=A0A345Y8P1_9NEIS|nr:DNA recombination protein RmuC [Crenobacter cavernae]AXK40293.1 DNA recombination protein RmuC [Crenobacter cavernae]
METLLAAIAGVVVGALLAWLLLKSRADVAQERGRSEGLAEVSRMSAEIGAAARLLEEARERERLQQTELALQRQTLAEQQQRLGQLEASAARLPQLEAQQAERDAVIAGLNKELRDTASRLAASAEQGRQLEALQQDLAGARKHAQTLTDDITRLTAREQELATRLEQERLAAGEKLQVLIDAREALSNQFKALANEIFEEKSKRFTEQNQSNLGQLLNPLHERIQGFGKLVQDTYDKDSKERLTLETELKRLQELNTRLGDDAVALTRALTGASSKTQGAWGEMVLEKVLEHSGLTRGREYDVQHSDVLETEEGGLKRYQPDVVIHLPEGKHLVIDSKVSLNAYVRHTAADDEIVREAELKAHIAALRTHIRTLSEKRYQDLYGLTSIDFVFMFVPVEPAYLLAVQRDMSLFTEAFDQRIVIVGPSTLLATLRTVASIWRYEDQNQNAIEIARQSGAMFDKFVGFVDTLEKLGKQLSTTQDSYATAMKQLASGSGNLVGRAEKLRKLGIKANKQLAASLRGDESEEDEDGEALLPG